MRLPKGRRSQVAAAGLRQEHPKPQRHTKHGLCFSPPPHDLRYLLSLQLPSPGQPRPGAANTRSSPLPQGSPLPKGPDKWEAGGRKAAGRPGPAAEAAALGGLRNPPQLQPVPAATRPCAAGVPSLAHSLRRALDRPVPSGLRRSDPAHVPGAHVAAGSCCGRTLVPSREGQDGLKDGFLARELVANTAGQGLPTPGTAWRERSAQSEVQLLAQAPACSPARSSRQRGAGEGLGRAVQG